MAKENKNTQPNTPRYNSTWKQVEIQQTHSYCRTHVQPKHNKVDPSWRKMCNFEVKAALWEWHREHKTAVNI